MLTRSDVRLSSPMNSHQIFVPASRTRTRRVTKPRKSARFVVPLKTPPPSNNNNNSPVPPTRGLRRKEVFRENVVARESFALAATGQEGAERMVKAKMQSRLRSLMKHNSSLLPPPFKSSNLDISPTSSMSSLLLL